MLGRTPSMLGRTLELLLCLRRRRVSSGSPGCSPLARAKRFKISVNDTTPDSLPLMIAPGSCPAEIDTPGLVLVKGGPGVAWSVTEPARAGVVIGVLWCMFGLLLCNPGGGAAWCGPGDGGTLVLGEGASTIHMRCERVAHSLATVCARVENGVT